MKESMAAFPSPENDPSPVRKTTRRQFLKALGGGLAALAAPSVAESGVERTPLQLRVERGKLFLESLDAHGATQCQDFLAFTKDWGIPGKDGQVFHSPAVIDAIKALQVAQKRCRNGEPEGCRDISISIFKLREAVRREM